MRRARLEGSISLWKLTAWKHYLQCFFSPKQTAFSLSFRSVLFWVSVPLMSSWRRVFPATWRKKGSRRIGCLSSLCCLCLDSSSILASFAESALWGKVILSPRGWQYCNDPLAVLAPSWEVQAGPLFLHSIARATSKEELEGWYTKPSADQPYCRVITSVNSCLRGLAGLVGRIVHLCSTLPPPPPRCLC